MRMLGRNLVTLLLIAVMAIPAMSSPVLRHSHADGDKSHEHGVATVERHEHSQQRGSKHSHSSRHSHSTEATSAKLSHDGHATHSANSPVEHRHVFWLGFECSWPLSVPDRSDSRQPGPNGDQWVPLISEVTLPDAFQVGSHIPAVDLLTPTELTPRLTAHSEVRPLPQPAAALLCDTACRERSGVLVI